jgi:hypothetical protein
MKMRNLAARWKRLRENASDEERRTTGAKAPIISGAYAALKGRSSTAMRAVYGDAGSHGDAGSYGETGTCEFFHKL